MICCAAVAWKNSQAAYPETAAEFRLSSQAKHGNAVPVRADRPEIADFPANRSILASFVLCPLPAFESFGWMS